MDILLRKVITEETPVTGDHQVILQILYGGRLLYVESDECFPLISRILFFDKEV